MMTIDTGPEAGGTSRACPVQCKAKQSWFCW